MRTIIDLLKKGNQELFYSAMIGWLLDPQGEHGLGDRVLSGLVETAGPAAAPLRRFIGSSFAVATEAPGSRSRYDILIKDEGEAAQVVIENKTKSIGADPQLDAYRAEGNEVIPLGLCEASFRTDSHVLTYRDLLSVLDAVGGLPSNAFGMLVDHFRTHLRHEIEMVDFVRALADGEVHERVRSALEEDIRGRRRNENDLRFLNLYLFEIIRPSLEEGRFAGWSWDGAKDQSSGTWLAQNPGMPAYTWSPAIQDIVDGEYLYFQFEMQRGVLAAGTDERAGEIQLRANTAGERVPFYERLRQVLGPQHRWARRPRGNAKFFKLISLPLLGSDLPREQLRRRLIEFMSLFGSFRDDAVAADATR